MSDSFHTVEISDPAYERDGLRLVTVKSRALGRRADITVWVPQAERLSGLLILLHGVWGSHWVWSMKGGVHHTAQRLMEQGDIAPMAIAMPNDGLLRDGSGYLTWPGGEDVERWIVDEVPAAARLAAPQLSEQAPMAIAGLSMGGYGALRLGAKYADRFCAISAHSAITDVLELQQFVEEPISTYLALAPREELSPLYWIRAAGGRLPSLRFDCGLDDALLTGNRALHAALQADSIPHIYRESPGGHHWSYWQQHVTETLRFAAEALNQAATAK